MKQKFEFQFGRNFTELTAIITLGCLLVFYGVVLEIRMFVLEKKYILKIYERRRSR